MTRRPAPDRHTTPELQALIDYLLAHKGRKPYKDLTEGSEYSARTLRRAVDGRMPTKEASRLMQ